MPRLRSEPLLFALLLIASVLIFLHQLNLLKPVEDVALLFFSPAQDALSTVVTGVDHFFGGFREAAEWRQKFEERQAMIDQLLVENTQLREKEKENETLRDMLSFKQANQNYQLLAADVIGRDPNLLLHYVIIDRGSTDGLARGMPVVTARGLVGQVSEANSHSAKVMLITDLASSVNAVAQETRAAGLVQGEVNGGLVMRFVPQGEKIGKGNIVLTSGLGGRFPKQLVIGQVEAVRAHDVELFQEADVRPSVDFHTLESVLVITNFAAD
ncbi:MAG: rod shape-determining protein MreC [Chloroflexota bacterium]